ncbi:isopeptide-forming domain-containing fimbrial protein [Collinsella sp. AM41-2BH]|uniref:isopeptide-forming domain-containing fimbrial protein n=1 Tax=Collinsella sp. AM41-2BH TaxID=2292320 RepID=UPI0013148380|nr:isopeptide-forming domain-containing fimbrial protein [Collinsella sp. AM41-2BH]
MSKNIARLAVTAGLTAALSFGGVMAPVTMAFAESAAGSTVTFNDPTYQETTTYKGIQIFTANVSDSAVTNIQWAGSSQADKDAIRDVVVSAIDEAVKAEDSTKSYSSKNAQEAAEWLNEHAETDEATKVASDNVLNVIAKKLNTAAFSGAWKATNQDNKSLSGLAAGYWLFLTNSVAEGSNNSSKDVFTSPVYAVVDGVANKVVTPKKSVPTVDKKIVSVRGDKELDASDSHVGQEVTYNLYGTVADNYDTYGMYFYKFSDQLSKGLTLETGFTATLYANKDLAQADINHANGTDVTSSFTQSAEPADPATGTKTTTWTCENLKSVKRVAAGSCIVVSYKAKINSEATVGDNAGNTNTVKLEYSNNPMTSDTGMTVPDEVKTYTYGLKLNKVDLGTEKALPDAKFTIKVKAAADSNLMGKYVQSDGTLGDDAHKFTTGDDGAIAVTGLGAGTYTVEETDAPENYDKVASFDFTIKSKSESGTSGESSNAEKYVLSASSNQVIIGTPNDKKGDNKLEAKTGTATNDDGTFNITVGDTKHVGLPLTGLNGVTFTWIAGGAVLCIGVTHLIRSRKQAEVSEQE